MYVNSFKQKTSVRKVAQMFIAKVNTEMNDRLIHL